MTLKLYGLRLGAAILTLCSPFLGRSQTTNCTTHDFSNGNYSITFNVENTSGADIIVTGINTTMYLGQAGTYSYGILYNTTPVNSTGATWSQGTVGAGQNGWVLGGTGTATLPSHTAPQSVITGLNITIPNGSTYGFALYTTSGIEIGYQTIAATLNNFSSGGVTLKTGTNISWGGAVYPATPGNYPRGWNGCVVWIPSVPCAAPANGGTITGPASVCPSTNFAISTAGNSGGTGTQYQWQSSPNGFTWTNVAGQTSTTFNGSQTAATNYRLRVICTNGPDTAYSNAITVGMNSFVSCYCVTAYPDGVEPITLVQFGSINNATSGTVNGTPAQENFTAMSTDVVKGLSYPITVNGNTDGNWTNWIVAYFDWNQNGLYNDPGETYQLGSIVNCANCGVNGNILVPAGALTGPTGMRVVKKFNTYGDPCNTTGFGQTEDYTVNVLPPPADEAGILEITKPEIAACSLGDKVWVRLQNLGTNPLTSATFTLRVNGLNVPTTPWSGSIAPQTSAEVMVPATYTLADGDSISVEVSLPNGQTENPLFAFNNLKVRKVWAGLSGVKSVYGATPDFADMNAAIQALQLRGVCDTVYFRVASNTYTGQYTFGEYPGAGPGKLAVFESASGNAADVTFAFDAASAADNWVFRFNNGDGYMVRRMTLQALDPTYAKIVTFANAPERINIESNILMGDTLAAYNAGDFERINIAGFDNTNPKKIMIRDNDIIGGSRSIDIEGATTAYGYDFSVVDNRMTKFNVVSVLLANVSKPVINGNTVRPRAGVVGNVYGLYAQRTIDGGSISGNDVQSEDPGFMFYINDVKGGAQDFWISNNFLYNSDTLAALSYGINVMNVNSSDMVIANNSISFANDNPASGAITITDGSQIRMFNNNVGAFGNAPAIRIEKSYSVSASNNNNFYGTSLANVLGSVYTSLSALQTGTGRDANSVSVDPGFSGSDLHTCAPALNAAGMPLANVTVDIDGDTRSATPDIGADEFLGDANDLLTDDAFLKCPADQVTIGNTPINGVTYSWTPSGSTSEITTATAGNHIITATSACGSFSDTAVVTNKPLPTASFTSVSVGLAGIFNGTVTNGTTYLWDFGDGQTSPEEDPTHVYEQAGTYSVSLTVTNECGSVTFGPQPVNVINVGIDEVDPSMAVNLFPNPTNGQFTVNMTGAADETTVITVIDITGKAVLVKNVPAGVNQVTLDATAFASGVYSVKVSNGETVHVIRLVRK